MLLFPFLPKDALFMCTIIPADRVKHLKNLECFRFLKVHHVCVNEKSFYELYNDLYSQVMIFPVLALAFLGAKVLSTCVHFHGKPFREIVLH